MSNFENKIDDIENRFHANSEEVSLLGLTIEIDDLVQQTLDEINRGRLVA